MYPELSDMCQNLALNIILPEESALVFASLTSAVSKESMDNAYQFNVCLRKLDDDQSVLSGGKIAVNSRLLNMIENV